MSLSRLILPHVKRLSRGIMTSHRLGSEELNVHRDSEDNNTSTPFEFSEPNMTRIETILDNYPKGSQQSAVIACLDIAQRQFGWVPIAAMHKIATILQMPRMRVYEVATFYTMNKRRPRGKYHVKVCVTTPCMIMGSDAILKAVEEATCCCEGSISDDGMFGIDTVQCAGACVNAPMFVIDDDYYEDVTVEDVHNIINTIRCGRIPRPGPQNGRTSCEPQGKPTSLICPPCPPPIQPALCEKPEEPK